MKNKQTNKQATTATTKNKSKQKQKRKKKQNKQTNKQKTKTVATEKVIHSQPQPIFSEGSCTRNLPVSISKICLLSIIYLRYGMMLFVMSHFLVKEIVFIELVKAISFSIAFTFRISSMRLFRFMNFFSLDLNTHNLNISSR